MFEQVLSEDIEIIIQPCIENDAALCTKVQYHGHVHIYWYELCARTKSRIDIGSEY